VLLRGGYSLALSDKSEQAMRKVPDRRIKNSEGFGFYAAPSGMTSMLRFFLCDYVNSILNLNCASLKLRGSKEGNSTVFQLPPFFAFP
jgi:hypothetical protein